MRLTVIGCSGSFAGPDSPASCYLLEHDGHRIVLDLGNGALGPLAAHADLASIDAVLLSHLHLDHIADVGGYYVARKYGPTGPQPPLPLVGPRGVAARVVSMYGDTTPEAMASVFDIDEHRPGPRHIGPFTITVTRVRHPVTAYATRVEAGGRALVFSGDTGPTDTLIELARGVDLALFEASFLEDEVRDLANAGDLHLTATQAAQHAAAAGVERLVLTHLVSWNDRAATEAEARAHFSGSLELASSGLVIDV